MTQTFASVIGSERPEDTNIVIFGAGGDLTKRKLLPALAHMHNWNLLGMNSRIIGVVRQKWTPSHWKNHAHQSLLRFAPEAVISRDLWNDFSQRLDLVCGDLADPEMYLKLRNALDEKKGVCNTLFYLAIPPKWYGTVSANLAKAGLSEEKNGYRRIVIEKPFGHDLHSAVALNRDLQNHFSESQIYRIDHYLGKESVQNLMVFRFGNSVLEPLWNRNFIDHVQITVAESLGIEYRAGYYEGSGAFRDMIQSHLMQVMTLVAMEPPASLAADAVRDEKVKVLHSMRPVAETAIDRLAVRAQYTQGSSNGQQVIGYRQEEGVDPGSCTETFAAVKLYVDNWRWHGVPFLLRTGKRLPQKGSEICIRFKKPPQSLFHFDTTEVRNNELVFQLQPNEGMYLTMTAKQPGFSMQTRELKLDAPYGLTGTSMPDAYETLLHDVLLGEAALFSRADEVEESWRLVKPILEHWDQETSIETYEAGTWNIPNADILLEGLEGGWRKTVALRS